MMNAGNWKNGVLFSLPSAANDNDNDKVDVDILSMS